MLFIVTFNPTCSAQVTSSFDSSPPPLLQAVPANQTLPRGSIALLPCRGSGPSSPKLYWKKNATDITALGSRFSIVQGGTLKIDGEYLPPTTEFCGRHTGSILCFQSNGRVIAGLHDPFPRGFRALHRSVQSQP